MHIGPVRMTVLNAVNRTLFRIVHCSATSASVKTVEQHPLASIGEIMKTFND